MYKTDNKFIADYCKASPQNLAFCHAGVQATIQQNTENLDNIMSQYKYKGINIPVFEWEQKFLLPFQSSMPIFDYSLGASISNIFTLRVCVDGDDNRGTNPMGWQ